ncbi:hypothetical protein YC2023_040630 [Brassica napus]
MSCRSLNARYVGTVSTWVEGLLRDISKRVSPPNGGQNLKKTYSDLQRQGCVPPFSIERSRCKTLTKSGTSH